jgi:hypothetical protein
METSGYLIWEQLYYAQLIWPTTTRVGCAMAVCTDTLEQVWVCHYQPAGNRVGTKPSVSTVLARRRSGSPRHRVISREAVRNAGSSFFKDREQHRMVVYAESTTCEANSETP